MHQADIILLLLTIGLINTLKKENKYGFFVSSITSCSDLWALIMDGGTGFSAQVHELSQHWFV
jgi:hypothetical protein